jgi:hypothetical protein
LNKPADKTDKDDIHFDADLLTKALQYHLRESGGVDPTLLEAIPTTVSISVARDTWANLEDEQRLSWLLAASRGKTPRRATPFGLGSRTPKAKQP